MAYMGDLLLLDGLSDILRWGALDANATTYTLTYDGNTNTGGTAPTDASSPYVYTAPVTTLGNTGALVKTSKVFNGWNTAANGTGTARAPGGTWAMGAGNVTLYAQWVDPVPPGAGGAAVRVVVLFSNGLLCLAIGLVLGFGACLLYTGHRQAVALRATRAHLEALQLAEIANPELRAAMAQLDYWLYVGPERPEERKT